MALRIKDNVDLKELEKIGFEKTYWDKLEYYQYDCKDNRTYWQVFIDTREICLHSGLYGDIPEYFFDNQLNIIYDLIKADLVEKVEDK